MGGHNGFGVDMQALRTASEGVQDAVRELTDMAGWGGGSTNVGQDGQGLAEGTSAAASDLGHDGLAAALADFGDQWEWGVRSMIKEAAYTTDALTDTRSAYQKAEEAVIGALKDAAQWSRDPNADGSWSEKSWDEITQEATQTTSDSYTSNDPWADALYTKPLKTLEQLTGLGTDGDSGS